jgi:two-component system sensor histidine kinase BarA
MLDSLEQSQEKLRQANKQLDAKIAQLSDRNIELFKANKLKGEFLANISHEFRTPLNAILGFAEILREKTTFEKEKTRRYAENIIASGRALLNMINDLLEMAKAETGKIRLHLEKTTIPELVRGLAAFFSPLTEQKKIKVKVQTDKKIPIIQTDPGKVQQILYNLLTNAIKFTPEKGKIEIRVTMPDEKTVRIAVSDTGPGIPEAEQDKIFEKFRQLDGSITRKSAGTGLGLAISKELAELLCGSIGVESRPERGATFWLEIPVLLQTAENGEKPRRKAEIS